MTFPQLILALAPAAASNALSLAQMIILGVFFFLVGACVGSFLNVVIWRLPYRGREVAFKEIRGKMTLSWPPSHCPMCDAPIAWYQNIPVLSYLVLRGKCANCRVSIPIRYPLVELATSMLWGSLFLAYFVAHIQGELPWVKHGPGQAVDNLLTDWAPYVWHAVFIAALLAASAIDADLFIIPLSIVWFLVAWGLAGSAALGAPLTRNYAIVPTLSVSGWALAKPIAGAAVGLLIANVLLLLKVLPRSFPWELEGGEPEASEALSEGKSAGKSGAKSAASKTTDHAEKPEQEEPLAPPPKLTKFWPSVIATLLIVVVIGVLWICSMPQAAALAGIIGGIVVFLLGVLPRDAGQIDVTDEVVDEISGPGVRLEILKELLFVAIPLACAGLAYLLPLELPQVPWLMRVLGSLLGLLAGGGVVWLLRIGGSLGFNKQAMGIGDVHLMAGVGAVIGGPLVLIAFFLSPFPGIIWAMLLRFMGKPNVLPYGPWLSVSSIIALVVGQKIICFFIVC